MARRLEMFCRVLVLRVVAAADMAAGKAHPQVHPSVAGLDTILANRDVFWMNLLYLIFVGTNFFGWHTLCYHSEEAFLSDANRLTALDGDFF